MTDKIHNTTSKAPRWEDGEAGALLLAIDVQNDFCHPKGTLYVPGATEDVSRLAQFLKRNRAAIRTLVLTQDSHEVMDIAHPVFWVDAHGQHPAPYTGISYQEVKEKKWMPRFEYEKVLLYLKKLEEQKEFPHTIWPQHCINGSWGAAISDEFMHEVMAWSAQGHYPEIVSKGMHPLAEHFGALRANVADPDVIATLENKPLLHLLHNAGAIFIAGEARSHCVANTVKQLFDYPDILKKIVLLDDCMSDVPGFETIAGPIYDKALELGARITNSDNVTI